MNKFTGRQRKEAKEKLDKYIKSGNRLAIKSLVTRLYNGLSLVDAIYKGNALDLLAGEDEEVLQDSICIGVTSIYLAKLVRDSGISLKEEGCQTYRVSRKYISVVVENILSKKPGKDRNIMETPSELKIKKGTVIGPKSGWKPKTYYIVNVIHKALFYSGFLTNAKPCGYNRIINPKYEENCDINKAYYLEVVEELDIDLSRD